MIPHRTRPTAKTKPRPLRLKRFVVQNWRNFREADVDIERRAFLVGPNASGKSNFLDALRFLHDIADVGGGLQQAVRKRGGVSSLRCLAAREYSNIRIHVLVGSEDLSPNWEYELVFNQDNQRRPVIKSERVLKEGKHLLDRPNDADRLDPERLTQTYIEQVQANAEFRELAAFFRSIRYLHIVPQLVREPDRSVGRSNDPFGGDFLEQVARTQKTTRNSRLKRITDALRVAVPQLQELRLDQDERGTWHLRGRFQHWRPKGQWQSEADFSDGTLRLLGLLWAVLDGTGPLLLEEPELSLHPDVVRYVPQMFARVQRRTSRQIITSTHSPDLLRDPGIGLDEVLLLEPSKEGTSVRRAEVFAEVRDLLQGGLTLPEAILPRTRPTHVEQLTLFDAV